MGDGRDILSKAEYLVIDEVHERDVNCDFLLAIVRNMLASGVRKTFKLILMSATVQMDKFKAYFNAKNVAAQTLEIKGSLHPIYVHHLETILRHTKFIEGERQRNTDFDRRCSQMLEMESDAEIYESSDEDMDISEEESDGIKCGSCGKLLEDSKEAFAHLAMCDYELGSSSSASVSSISSIDEKHKRVRVSGKISDNILCKMYQESLHFRQIYEEQTDFDLILDILEHIYVSKPADLTENATVLRFGEHSQDLPPPTFSDDKFTLIFMPGWSEISTLVNSLESHPTFKQSDKYEILPLHSGIEMSLQRKIFDKPRKGIRRIVCSTNIAETSVTIDNVGFVIDLCQHRTMIHDPERQASILKTVSCDKHAIIQRSGRAGRVAPGLCFRLMSSQQYDDAEIEKDPPMLHTPLEEICLQVGMLIKPNISREHVAEFLAGCVDPPAAKTVSNALDLLEQVGAFAVAKVDNTEWYEMTNLGRFLARLSIHPLQGKMLLMSYLIGAMDVGLDLCALNSTDKDPFFMTQDYSIRKIQDETKLKYNLGTQNDDVVLLKLLHEFKNSRDRFDFCKSVYVSIPTMQLIQKQRKKLRVEFLSALEAFSDNKLKLGRSKPPIEFKSGLLESLKIMSQPTNFMFKMKTRFETNVKLTKKSAVKKLANIDQMSIHKGDLISYTRLRKKEDIRRGEIKEVSFLIGNARVSAVLSILFTGILDITLSSPEEDDESSSVSEKDTADVIAEEFMTKFARRKDKKGYKGRLIKESRAMVNISEVLEVSCTETLARLFIKFRERLEHVINLTLLRYDRESQVEKEFVRQTVQCLRMIIKLHSFGDIHLEKDFPVPFSKYSLLYPTSSESESDANLDMRQRYKETTTRKKKARDRRRERKEK